MAILAHGERDMNFKKIAALAALSALTLTAGPAMAAAPTGTITVDWNYAITATITMFTQASASQTHSPGVANAAGQIYWVGNGSTSSGCNGTTNVANAGLDTAGAAVNGVVDFGNVVADSVDYTNCLEKDAADAYIVTNDSLGANLTVQATAGAPSDYDTASNGSLLCILPTSVWNTAGNTAYTASSRVAAVAMSSTVACSAGTAVPAASAANILALTKSTTGSDLVHDIQLNMGPAMQSGAQSVTLTYTLTTN